MTCLRRKVKVDAMLASVLEAGSLVAFNITVEQGIPVAPWKKCGTWMDMVNQDVKNDMAGESVDNENMKRCLFFSHSFRDFFQLFRFLVKAFNAEPCEEDWVPTASQLTLTNSCGIPGYEAWGSTDPCLKSWFMLYNFLGYVFMFFRLPGVWQGQGQMA